MKTLSDKTYLKLSSIFLFCVGLSAVFGGYGLLFMNGLGMPASWLEPTFHSFIIPGLILGCVVGGSYILSSILLFRGSEYALEATAVAGFGLTIWIFTELYIIGEPHRLQIVYFGIAILTLVLNMIFSKYKTRLF